MTSTMNLLMKPLKSSLINLPTPTNISLNWNFGSLLGLVLVTQISTGLFLSMHYSPSVILAFDSIIHIMRDVNYGWFIRIIHANGASLFFIFLFAHIARGLYYNSINLKMTWSIGVMIFLLTMMTAFLGYVLPWGQMSFWGATVITNLLSAIPYISESITTWVWGGFSISDPTLNRLYSLHFILPFFIAALVLTHLVALHNSGSSNPLGSNSNLDKISFHPYFTLKDSLTVISALASLILISLMNPFILSDPENFISANPMVTPIHIQPEWYFLFAYAILRSIPNKLGGVVALSLSISLLFILPLLSNNFMTPQSSHNKLVFWMFSSSFLTLSWAGAKPVEPPFILISQLSSLAYFSFLIMIPIMNSLNTKLLK